MKIINDTLKKSNGKWDKQALTFFVSFLLSIAFGITNTIVSYISGIVNNPTSDNIFNSFMFLTAALSGANIANKYVDVVKARSEKRDEVNPQYRNDDDSSTTRY